jgi:predicted solute-binding protein
MARDPFFPDWIYALGIPHFSLYSSEVYNIMFELTILAFLFALFIIEVIYPRTKSFKQARTEREKQEKEYLEELARMLKQHEKNTH